MATAALVLGLVGLFLPLVPIAAVICGALSIQEHRGMATAGIVLGGLGLLGDLVLYLVVGVWVVPGLAALLFTLETWF